MRKRERVVIRILVGALLLAFLLLMIVFYRYTRPLVIGPLIAPENITLISPSQTYYSTLNVVLNVSLTDIVLQLNMTLNGVVTALCQNCNSMDTLLTLSNGQYNLTVSAYDASSNASKDYSFIVDTLTPEIAFDGLTPGNGSILNNSVYVGLSLTDANFANVTYSFLKINETLNASGAQPNETLLLNTTLFFVPILSVNFTVNINGTYLFNASVVDKVGKVNVTETRTVFVAYFCSPQWIGNSTCNASNVNFIYYTDGNLCKSGEAPPANISGSCDYCTPRWVDRFTSCVNNQRIRYQVDENTCYTKTLLASDLAGIASNETETCGTSQPPSNNPPNQNPPSNNSRTNATRVFLNASQIYSGFYATLASNDIIEFNFSGTKHIIKATSVFSSSFVAIFDSNSYLFLIDEEKEFDLTGDEVNDLGIKLRSISGGRASLFIKEIPLLYTDNATRQASVNETFEYAEDKGLSPKTVYLLAGGVIAFVILIIGGVWFVIWYSARKEKLRVSVGKKGKSAVHSS